MSVNSKMKAIADQIRTLVGASGTMTLDAMASNVSTANGAVTTQADLIAQILTAVEEKMGGKGGFSASDINFEAMAFGTYTPTEDKKGSGSDIGINNGKVGICNLGVVFCPELFSYTSGDTYSSTPILAGICISNKIALGSDDDKQGSAWVYRIKSSGAILGDGMAITANPSSYAKIYATSQYFLAGYTYYWIIFGEAV